MARQAERALTDLTGTGQNAGVTISDLESSTMWVVGTFVATAQVQVSPDGTNWVNEGSALTAPGRVLLTSEEGKQARIDVTAFTSGTIESIITGKDEDVKG